jgi:hypothetical protein
MRTLYTIAALALCLGTEQAAHASFLGFNLVDPATRGDARGPVFVDMSVSLDFFSIDLSSRDYAAGVSPGVGYGIKWKPDWYTLTDVLVAFDLFVQAQIVERNDALSGPDFFAIDVLPVITIADWVGVGLGPRFQISLHPEADSSTVGVFTFGLRTSL